VYVLYGAAVLLPEYYRSDLPDYIGRYLPYFPDLKQWTPLSVAFSINEIFIVLVVVIWLLKGVADRRLRFDRGSLMLPLGLYMGMVLAGEIHGLMTGGDFRTSLWEVRGQAYMFVAYVLTCNLIHTRRQIWTIIWVLMLGSGLRGVEGMLRYIAQRGSHAQELYPHEQSFFFNGFLTLFVVLLLFKAPPRMRPIALALLPFVAIANLANGRRAAVFAFFVAVFALFVITWVVRPARRRTIALVLLGLAAVFPPYYLAFRHSTSTYALPARAVSTIFNPSTRDAASDQYRATEDADIIFTMKTSPIVGYGFGKPMLLPYPLPNISAIYVFWNIMPHNSIYWIWMRLGTVGYLLLWLLFGVAIVQSTDLARRLRDPRLQGLAVLIALLVVEQVIYAYLDLEWSNWRNLISTGVLFALISRLAKFTDAADETSDEVQQPTMRSKPGPVALGVVHGRVKELVGSRG
jgi:O-antigen ligase